MWRSRSGYFVAWALATILGCDCGGSGIATLAPRIEVRPSPVAFEPAYVGVTARRPLFLKNVGTAVLHVESIRVKPGSAAGLAIEDARFELDPGEERAVEARLTPDALGPIEGALLVASDDPRTPILEVPIAARGETRPGPAILICAESVDLVASRTCGDAIRFDFGGVGFGTARDALVTITSAGTEPLDASVAVEGGAHPSIVFSPSSTRASLPPQASLTLTVRFSPAVPEDVFAVLRVGSNDPDRPSVPVIFSGHGIVPAFCPSPELVDFGVVPIGESRDRILSIGNCGDARLELRGVAVETSPEFTVLTPITGPVELAPGEGVEVGLRYTPADPGSDQDRLRILSTIGGGAVPLIGRAASCRIATSPTAVQFGGTSAQGASRRVLLENQGEGVCELRSVELGPGTSSEFSVTPPAPLPSRLDPAVSTLIDVRYQPSGPGGDSGTLILGTSDPTQPVISIPLSGRRLGAGECALEARPDPAQFGAVPMGTTASLVVDLENIGGSLCTVLGAALSSGSSRSFQIVPPSLPWLIPAGQSRSVELLFTPTEQDPQSGELQIVSGLVPLSPTLVVPITGSGSGPRLCPHPSPLVFGTRVLGGGPTTRALALDACGTEPIVVSGIELLSPPTSAEYSFSNPPAVPIVIAPGTTVSIDVVYSGVDLGRDDGVLRLLSNDALAGVRDVPLVAASSDAPCGDIQGNICDLTNTGPARGARVFVDTPSGRLESTTDHEGDFVITCVPEGTWAVRAQAGSWNTSFSAQVTSDRVTVIPGSECLDPDSASVAVVEGAWDRIEDVLASMGIPYALYGGGTGARIFLEDESELARYDIVFFNCGWEDDQGLSSEAVRNLRDFVANGGSIYASDWSYDVVEVGWPSFVDFAGDDAFRGNAEGGPQFNGMAHVADPGLILALGGRANVPITVDSSGAGIDGTDPATSVYLEADRYGDGVIRPTMIGFLPTPSSGRVFYTDFHNHGQQDILDIFRWLVQQL